MERVPKIDNLGRRLLAPVFSNGQEEWRRYETARLIAEHYATAENAVAVLSNMACDLSYICYGRLGERLGLGTGSEEVDSIWEQHILERIHPDDVAGKIAWELQLLNLVKGLPADQRRDYYLLHYLRIRDGQGRYRDLCHRILYLDYDTEGNVLLALCLYTAHNERQDEAGIYCSLDDRRVGDAGFCTQGILSERECEVLSCIGRGMASKQIADALCISVNTVSNHRQNIIRKLRCQNTTEAVCVARRLGLLSRK